MKIILLLSCLFTLCIFPIHGIFAFTGETIKPQTLIQGQVEIKELQKQDTILRFQWSTFQLGNESIGDIMKLDLTQEDKEKLESVISLYVESRKDAEKVLERFIASGKNVEDVQIELLNGKHLFYKELIPYIQIEKLDAFKKYVDSDLTYNEKSKNIKVQIEQKNIEQNQLIEKYDDDAQDNSKNFRKEKEELISTQVREKLDIFIAQENFRNLPAESKTKVFSNIVDKFNSAINDLEQNINPTRALEDRIFLLEVVVEILKSYIYDWD